MPRRTIIVPIDGSRFSRQIVAHLSQVCDPASDALVLLRVAGPAGSLIGAPPRPVSSSWTAPMFDRAWDIEYTTHPIYATQIEQSERSALELELLPEREQLEQLGFTAKTVVRFGDPADEIAAVAAEEGAALIAMATHGRTGLRHLLMGSVAEQVLRRVDIPVLMLRPFNTEMRM